MRLSAHCSPIGWQTRVHGRHVINLLQAYIHLINPRFDGEEHSVIVGVPSHFGPQPLLCWPSQLTSQVVPGQLGNTNVAVSLNWAQWGSPLEPCAN
jgi:hypothetical protein